MRNGENEVFMRCRHSDKSAKLKKIFCISSKTDAVGTQETVLLGIRNTHEPQSVETSLNDEVVKI